MPGRTVLFGLEAGDLERLSRLLRAFESGRLNADQAEQADPLPARINQYLATTTSIITARVGATLGTGTAAIYRGDFDDPDLDLVDADLDDVTVYNRSTSAIASGTEVWLRREPISGRLIAEAPPSAGSVTLSRCRVYKTATTTIGTAADTLLTWTSEATDTDGYHDNVTNPARLTAPTTAVYLIEAGLNWVTDFTNTGVREVHLQHSNGFNSQLLASQSAPGLTNRNTYTHVSALARLTAGQWVQVVCYQNTGVNINISTSFAGGVFTEQGWQTYFQMTRLIEA